MSLTMPARTCINGQAFGITQFGQPFEEILFVESVLEDSFSAEMGLEPESVMRRMLNYRNGLKAESGAEGVTDFGLGPESVTYFPCWQLIAGEQDIVDNTRENYS